MSAKSVLLAKFRLSKDNAAMCEMDFLNKSNSCKHPNRRFCFATVRVAKFFNCQLVLGAINFLSAMEFADPRTGEPPDNFRADNSCGVRKLSDAAGDFLC